MPALIPEPRIKECLLVRLPHDHCNGLLRHTTLTAAELGVRRVFVWHIRSFAWSTPNRHAHSRARNERSRTTSVPM